MLRRIVYMSRSIGTTGLSTMALAHILGAGERNNRRDEISAALIVRGDRILQALEGPHAEVGRALERIKADSRHTDVEVIIDAPTTQRTVTEPMDLCADPEAFLHVLGLPCLSLVTSEAAEAYVERRLAA